MAIDGIPGKQVFIQRDVRRTPAGVINIQAQISPIGSVVAWIKTFANTPSLPAGWVECDGAAINDADSVYDGQNSPDLNGGIFLEGQATSGATGGSASMSHTHTLTTTNQAEDTGGSDFLITFATTSGASNSENRPPFYTVVWIMRIK